MNALMACANNLDQPIEDWTVGGVPITMMCHMERRKGKDKPVIMKALVELDGPRSQPFKAFAEQREKWMVHDMYRAPAGAIQFFSEGARNANMTLMYELLGDKAKALTECDLSETAAPAPVEMGESKFLFRPATKALRSLVERARLDYQPKVPDCLKSRSLEGVGLESDERSQSSKMADRGPLERMFPGTYGARLLQQVLGVVGGTVGLFEQSTVEITDDLLHGYCNQGGFDLLGRSRDSIRTETEMDKAKASCEALDLDGLVLIGGNTTATDAAFLAEYFHAKGVKTSVVGVPCTISGGMKNNFVESAVGFDTAVKVYSQLVGNTAIDGASARKYWYFMRLMGQDPSHIALEVAMQTHPNMVLLAEDVRAKRWSLHDIVKEISDVVQTRSEQGKEFGAILIPEGLVVAIPEMEVLIEEIDALYVEHVGPNSESNTLSRQEVQKRLTGWSAALLASLPAFIQEEVC
ncbi:unnamed protein product, partial [Laminaria digitata]